METKEFNFENRKIIFGEFVVTLIRSDALLDKSKIQIFEYVNILSIEFKSQKIKWLPSGIAIALAMLLQHTGNLIKAESNKIVLIFKDGQSRSIDFNSTGKERVELIVNEFKQRINVQRV